MKISIFGICIIGTIVLVQTSIYSYSVAKLEGGDQSLSAFQNKKILVITLPVQQNAGSDSLLYSLDTLAAARTSSLAVIATPSFEDGYSISQQSELLQWYRSKLGSYILITDGLYSRKTSGSQQHPLYKWLTDATLNGVFDMDVTGPNYKFIVRGNGQLYGVLPPQTKISGASMQKTLQMQ